MPASCCSTKRAKREIDVVAAQQNVLANRDAFQLQFAVLLGDGDQGEVGGAAADVDHQNQVAHLNPLAPIRMPLDPGVEGGLRLFEQQNVLISGLFGGLQGQLAGDRVEGCRNRHQNFLLLESGRPGCLAVPGMPQMFQILARNLDRRKLLNPGRSIERQQRSGCGRCPA